MIAMTRHFLFSLLFLGVATLFLLYIFGDLSADGKLILSVVGAAMMVVNTILLPISRTGKTVMIALLLMCTALMIVPLVSRLIAH
jgi:hypothetical protein